ncbi:MAG: hypothetical protein MHMPM18_001580 [Marteilia pararefringens]
MSESNSRGRKIRARSQKQMSLGYWERKSRESDLNEYLKTERNNILKEIKRLIYAKDDLEDMVLILTEEVISLQCQIQEMHDKYPDLRYSKGQRFVAQEENSEI